MTDKYNFEFHIRKNGKLFKFHSIDEAYKKFGQNIIEALQESKIEYLKEFTIQNQINNSILNQLYRISDILLLGQELQLYQKFFEGVAAIESYRLFNSNDSKTLEKAYKNILSFMMSSFYAIKPTNVICNNNYVEILKTIENAVSFLVGILFMNKDFTDEEKRIKIIDCINHYKKLLDSLETQILVSLVDPYFSPVSTYPYFSTYVPCDPIEADINYYSIQNYNFRQNPYTDYLVYMKDAFKRRLNFANTYKIELRPQENILCWINYQRECINDFCHPASHNIRSGIVEVTVDGYD